MAHETDNVICFRCRLPVSAFGHLGCMDPADQDARHEEVAERMAAMSPEDRGHWEEEALLRVRRRLQRLSPTGTETAGGPVAGYAREHDDDE